MPARGTRSNEDISVDMDMDMDMVRALLELSPGGIIVANRGGIMLMVNAEIENIFGYRRRELVGQSLEMLLPAGERETHAALRRSYERQPTRRPMGSGRDLQAVHRNGNYVDIEIGLAPIGRHVLAVVSDITERRRLQRAAAAGRSYADRVVDMLHQPIVVLDATLTMVAANPAYCRMVGVTKESIAGESVAHVGPAVLYDPPHRRAFLGVVETGIPIEDERIEVPTIGDGFREMLLTVRRLPRPGGDPDALVLALVDITDRVHLERERAAFTAQLEARVEKRTAELAATHEHLREAQKLEAVGRLAGGVAHDFNNMLSVITGSAALALEALSTDDSARVDIEQVLFAAQRAETLVQQLLAFSRQREVTPVVVNLNHWVRPLERMLTSLLGEGVGLTIHLAPDLWDVRVDSHALEQVLVNLLLNARDALPLGGNVAVSTANSRPRRELAARDDGAPLEGDCVVIEVRDTGIGIPDDVVGRVFEPFFTTKDVGRGTGLGLASCYGIVRQAHGRIEVDSELGQGTSFRVYLPRAPAEAPARSSARPEPLERCTAGEMETILVVEDEDSLRAVVVRQLRRAGFRVVAAHGGAEALDVLQSAGVQFDLVLTDVMMPLMRGDQLADRISKSHPQLRVIFMSGYNVVTREIEDRERIPVLQKPFTISALLDHVRKALA